MRRGTYSIVARDPGHGELGVAVQSHWFSVGSVVAWARPGVGAVATQSVAEVAHGPNMLDRMQEGLDARAADQRRSWPPTSRPTTGSSGRSMRRAGRQPHRGRAASPSPDDAGGESFACQANMMGNDTVPAAMAGGLPQRRGRSRRAAPGEPRRGPGGRRRCPRASSRRALLVVPAEGEPWRTRFDIRVEDHPDPLGELRRLARFARAYEMAGRADELAAEGEHAAATELYLGLGRAGARGRRADVLGWAGARRRGPRPRASSWSAGQPPSSRAG